MFAAELSALVKEGGKTMPSQSVMGGCLAWMHQITRTQHVKTLVFMPEAFLKYLPNASLACWRNSKNIPRVANKSIFE